MIEFGYLADKSGKGITTLYKASAPGFLDICVLLIKALVPVDTRKGHWGYDYEQHLRGAMRK